jgi:hypothetical protein
VLLVSCIVGNVAGMYCLFSFLNTESAFTKIFVVIVFPLFSLLATSCTKNYACICTKKNTAKQKKARGVSGKKRLAVQLACSDIPKRQRDAQAIESYTNLTSKIGAHAPTPLHPLRLAPYGEGRGEASRAGPFACAISRSVKV